MNVNIDLTPVSDELKDFLKEVIQEEVRKLHKSLHTQEYKFPAGPLYSIKDAAVYLNVSEQTIRLLIKQGKIKKVEIGNNWKVVKSTLDEYIVNNCE